MYLISNFEYSISLEKAITELQMKGIAKDSILAVPLDKRKRRQESFSTAFIIRIDTARLISL